MQILDILSLAVGIVGVSVIIWGVFTTLHSMIKLELRRLKKENMGSIVVIRTIISYFLNKELSGSHDCTQDFTEAVKEKQL